MPAEVTNARRIEGGLLFAGADFDETMTPFEAGFGSLIDWKKGDFIGREALSQADQRRRTWGLTCAGGTALHGDTVFIDGVPNGRVTSSAFSPTLQTGVAIVRLADADLGPGTLVEVLCADGEMHPAQVSELPLFDRAGDIPRGRDLQPPMAAPIG